MRLRLDGGPICRLTRSAGGLLRGSMRLLRLGAVCILLLVISNVGDVTLYADGGCRFLNNRRRAWPNRRRKKRLQQPMKRSPLRLRSGVDEPTVGEAN